VDEITLTITGTPAPQGSKDAMPIYKGSKKKGTRVFTGRVNLVESSATTLKPWRAAVTLQARRQYDRPAPLDVPLSVGMVFLIARPKSVRRPYPNVKPDLSKLVRAVEDALTDAKVWRDDALVVRYHELDKRYAAAGEQPGVLVSIRPLAAVALPGRVAPRQGRPDSGDVDRLRHRLYGAESHAEPFSA
jgi:Holliday junction resolvase RusA-like endonuclease